MRLLIAAFFLCAESLNVEIMRRISNIIILLFSAAVFSKGILQDEIVHLIGFVSASECTFIRNGKEYEAQEAASHIRKKYEYFKEDILSTEQFIELSASRSTISKKKYQIQCKGAERITSQKWLLDELEKYRKIKTV